jgi:hypothetical protein
VTGASWVLDGSASGNDPAKARVREAYGRLPLSFEGNRGQTDPSVKFLARGGGYTLFLTSTEAMLALDGGGESVSGVRLHLVGANPAPSISGQGELAGRRRSIRAST